MQKKSRRVKERETRVGALRPKERLVIAKRKDRRDLLAGTFEEEEETDGVKLTLKLKTWTRRGRARGRAKRESERRRRHKTSERMG